MELRDRLIIEPFIAVDDGGEASLHRRLMALAKKLPLGMTISVNTALLSHGFGLIDELHDLGLNVLADLRLDINDPITYDNVARLLANHHPEVVTVSPSYERPLISEIGEILSPSQIWINLVGWQQHKAVAFQVALENQFHGYLHEDGVWKEEWQKAARKRLQPNFRFVAKCYPEGALTPKWAMRHGCDKVVMVVMERDLERESGLISYLQGEITEGLMVEETVPDCPCSA